MVEPREVAALLGETAAPPAPVVETCDFRRPRRLSAAQLDELRAVLSARLPAAETELAEALGLRPKLELVALSEAHAEALFGGAPEPLLALRFRTNGQLGWVLWQSQPAIECVERVLGATTASKAARRLSSVEAKVLEGLLEALVRPLLKALGLTPSEVQVVQDKVALGSWRDGAKSVDSPPSPHRLGFELGLEGLGGPTSLHVFLAGFQEGLARPAAASARVEVPAAVPAHLQHVQVELHALLSGVEIPLAQLLRLEEGDVIPIEAELGDHVQATVNGRAIAAGKWGTHAGRMAIRIDQLETEKETGR